MKAKSFLHNIFKSFTSPSSPDSSSTEPDLDRIASREQKHFSYDSLSKATDKFHANRKLGEGGFGPVYKGRLEDGREIAVKRLSQTSRQGKKEFQNEARLLARVQHRNVVNLLGYCARGEDKLLVYEYIPNESLDKLLFMLALRNGSALHPFYLSGVMHSSQPTASGICFNGGDGIPNCIRDTCPYANQKIPNESVFNPSSRSASSDQKIYMPVVLETGNSECPSVLEPSTSTHCRPFNLVMPSKDLYSDSN